MSSNITFILNVSKSYEEFNFINNYYLIPFICVLSALLNLAIFFTLSSVKIDKNFLYYLKWKCLNDTLISMFGSTIGNSMCDYCVNFIYNSLIIHIYRIYFLRYFVEILSSTSCLLEILITYDRLCLINGTNGKFNKVKALYLYWFFFLFCMLLYLPEIFVYHLELQPDGLYSRLLTTFGLSIYYNYYYLFLIGLLSVMAIILVTVFNFQIYATYSKFLKNKNRINGFRSRQETNSTKMIVVMNVLFVVPMVYFDRHHFAENR